MLPILNSPVSGSWSDIAAWLTVSHDRRWAAPNAGAVGRTRSGAGTLARWSTLSRTFSPWETTLNSLFNGGAGNEAADNVGDAHPGTAAGAASGAPPRAGIQSHPIEMPAWYVGGDDGPQVGFGDALLAGSCVILH